ncbi:MAG: hypothetical protein H7Y27_12810 [Gemmatimonadaceae bacterium]|nr:hypothetical protein [Chitinophagaceae bacterium]
MLKRDNFGLGLILGFLTPLLGMVIYYFIAFYPSNIGFKEFLLLMKQYKSVLTAVSSISLVANAVLFTYYVNTRKDRTTRGVFVATLIYGITVLLIKLVG